ncbi:hypothetical protein E3V84_10405 [Streptococcus pseudopneumoniae]|nr:hypothetical protein E3V84_10405 [Streptococcus pseudopneumoniae]
MEIKSIFNNGLEITVGYSIFNYPDSIAIIVFLDYKKLRFANQNAVSATILSYCPSFTSLVATSSPNHFWLISWNLPSL